MIGGDVAHFERTFDDLVLPLFADDHDAQETSVLELRALRDAGSTVLPGHDPEALLPGILS